MFAARAVALAKSVATSNQLSLAQAPNIVERYWKKAGSFVRKARGSRLIRALWPPLSHQHRQSAVDRRRLIFLVYAFHQMRLCNNQFGGCPILIRNASMQIVTREPVLDPVM